ncbi:MAG TPA: glycosyltransferase N-terminal domain-containing protein [Caulobacteraceae bacterium]|nr:glycosyltransferase N-terminal domain-containing protein [Caulobacteraceae bacterium]
MSLRLYGIATRAAAPFVPILLRSRVRRGLEEPARLAERLGHPGLERPGGRLAWMHAVSVGEGLSLLPLMERLRNERPDVTLLLTTGTLAAADVMARRLPQVVLHQFAPIDSPRAMKRFLDHWRPELAILVESELWPNMILAAKRRGVKLALLSARMSERSFRGWRRVPTAAEHILGAFDLVLAKDPLAAQRFAALGARIDGAADMKFGAPPLPVSQAALAALGRALENRVVIVAASTHAGEESMLLERLSLIDRKILGTALCVVVPRHPARGSEIAAMATARGFKVARRSSQLDPSGADVYVADTLGEMGLWYRLANLAILGGSFAPGIGGHNPLEPARLGCPFITGTQVEAWPIYEGLEAAGATATISRPEDLDGWLEAALLRTGTLVPMGRRARDFVVARDAGAHVTTDRVLGLLPP